MSETTAHLALPFIMASQAQKHITHNEALRLLDGIVQLSVLDRDLTDPPASPAEGARYIPASGATGAWSGWDGNVAYWIDGAWMRLIPQPGWLAWVHDEGVLLGWTGSAWAPVGGGGGGDGEFDTVEIGGASADSTNRLAINALASLFNHAGAGHQIKVNKNAAGDTASMLFQTNWSGRAEMGLLGSDAFGVKVSADGSTWREALVIDGAGTSFAGQAFYDLDQFGGPSITLRRATSSPNAGANFAYQKVSGSFDSPTALIAGEVIAQSAYAAHNGVTMSNNMGATAFKGAENWSPGNQGTRFTLEVANVGTAARREALTVEADGAVTSAFDNVSTLGTGSTRWSAVYAANGTIQTSDERDKDVIGSLADYALDFVRNVDPVLFRWHVGGNTFKNYPAYEGQIPSTVDDPDDGDHESLYLHATPGARTHAGFIAQDVRSAMVSAGVDFGAWGLEDKDDPESRQFLRPDQLVPLLWAAVQQLSNDVAALKDVAK